MENLKLQFDYNSFYLCLLYLALLWLGILMLNRCSEKYHGIKLQEWKTLMESTLDPKDWGWRLEDAPLVPVMTDE